MKDKKFNVLKGGYRFNKFLVKFFFIFMALLILPQFVWSVNGILHGRIISVSCVSEFEYGFCKNPYFGNCNVDCLGVWCLEEELPNGFVFNPLPWYYDLYQLPVMILLLLFFGFNHVKYNKDFFKDKDGVGKDR